MGAGGGMCAKAREELLRPGLRGGGGGKPLDEGVALGKAATGATATGFWAALGAATTGVLVGVLAVVLADAFRSDFGALFAGALTGAVAAAFTFCKGLAAETAFAAGLTAAFLAAVGAGLLADFAAAVLVNFFGTGLATVTFLAATGLAAGFTAFLATTAAFGFDFTGGASAFVFTTGLATNLGAGLPAGFADFLAGTAGFFRAFAAALTGNFDALGAFTADLAAVLDFLICAFTEGLLWEAAPW